MNAFSGRSKSGDGRKRLITVFDSLPEQAQATLLEFAEFLASRYPKPQESLAEPEPIPRPAEESVVKAIKRLSLTYHMIDRSVMLNDTSVLMSQHIMHGRSASEIIDELEVLFRREYEKLCDTGK